MNEAEKLAERYVAVWNETDPQRRRETIAALWAPEGIHYVGSREVQGYDALEQRVTGSHEKNVRDGGHRFEVSAVRACRTQSWWTGAWFRARGALLSPLAVMFLSSMPIIAFSSTISSSSAKAPTRWGNHLSRVQRVACHGEKAVPE